MIEKNKIYNIDCLEFMKKLPDNYFDLVITDPPYGIGESNEKNSTRGKLAKPTDFSFYNWDKSIPSAEYFKEILRVSKNQIIFGGNYFIEHLHNSSCWIVWDKNNGSNDFADCELAWTSFSSAVRKFKYTWNGMLQENMKFKEKRFHPTQKPLALSLWIYDNFVKDNFKIFDPFCGSGTFLYPAKTKGLEFVGCDKEKKYVDYANKRLNQNGLSQFNINAKRLK